MAKGITLDTGALIAIGRRQREMVAILNMALKEDLPVTVPAPVLAQWWRGCRQVPGTPSRFVDDLVVQPMCGRIAREVGEALAETGETDIVDAMVMVTAAARDDLVYSSDPDDLPKYARLFPGVRVVPI